jgi:hypothetical protein
MSGSLAEAWDERVGRALARAPQRLRDGVEWLRHPGRRIVRIGAAILLVLGGILSILPVLGLWMLPLGLALLAEDIPGLKPHLENAARWLERAWRRVRGAPRSV